MLTRELLNFRVRQGVLRPVVVKRDDTELLTFAHELLAEVEASRVGQRDDIEESLGLKAGAFTKPKVARGLVKLVLDRLLFDEPAPGVTEARWERIKAAGHVLRALPPDATVEDFEARLAQTLPIPLAEAREALYSDLPGHRRLVGWDGEALDAQDLLDRYNLALAQGPLMSARRLRLRAQAPDLLRVRKVLRWLKFCRLVAEVWRDDDNWALDVEGVFPVRVPGIVARDQANVSRRRSADLAGVLVSFGPQLHF